MSDATNGKLRFDEDMMREMDQLAQRYPKRQALLLPALWMGQRKWGCLSPAVLEAVAEAVHVSPVKAYSVAAFYTMYYDKPMGKYNIQVCNSISCHLRGADDTIALFEKKLGIKVGETTDDGLFSLGKAECLAACGSCPVAMVQVDVSKRPITGNVNGDYFEYLDEASIDNMLEKLRHDNWEEVSRPRLFDKGQPVATVKQTDRPMHCARFGIENSHTLEVYKEHGGYEQLRQALQMEPSAIVEAVKQSGLRGRGGAGFPTGMKWGFLPAQSDKPRYLVVNADESEPGTFKDRYIMELDPHLLIEGCLITCWANDVHDCYIYIRGEFDQPTVRVKAAVSEAEAAGIIGDRVMGSEFSCRITVHVGAGAYICGEETGLLESLEGNKGFPRPKPPFPAVVGAFGGPTIINNVETMTVIPWIIEHGAEAHATYFYDQETSPKAPGTKLFSISGHVNRPGVYEVPLGIPFMKFLNEVAGGMKNGKKLKAVIPGGASAQLLTAAEVEHMRLDFESIGEAGSMLGSGAIIVMDEDTDIVKALSNITDFFAHESCGQCTPCREGCPWAAKILRNIIAGKGKPGDLDLLLDIANGMEARTICALATAAAWPLQSYITKFRDEFEAYVKLNQANHVLVAVAS